MKSNKRLNSTHLTQPLNVAYFTPMKIAWLKILTDWNIKGISRRALLIPKDEFLVLSRLLLDKLNDSGRENLISGFRKQVYIQMNDSTKVDMTDTVHQSHLEHLKEARRW